MNSDLYIWPQPEERPDGKLNLITNAELLRRAEQRKVEFFNDLQHWQYRKRQRSLRHKEEPDFEVDLTDFKTKADCLDWILTVHSKRWMKAAAFVEFMTAVEYLIHPDQLPKK